ncbi:formylglycine-generating enzyme family protein [Pontibacter sp. G13]|uniref:formylglycine-generating enzyme family protein n=1 Tax=Pontibacter sp. G13 TaxID=3074898 RepID=UPI00288B43D1|nr:formylglycine-generating enzyme family protein [Pontibacter sp. G13]WNJ19793.1 formylglycine-generating enzyme family protein [Pontibacter sp. G13]
MYRIIFSLCLSWFLLFGSVLHAQKSQDYNRPKRPPTPKGDTFVLLLCDTYAWVELNGKIVGYQAPRQLRKYAVKGGVAHLRIRNAWADKTYEVNVKKGRQHLLELYMREQEAPFAFNRQQPAGEMAAVKGGSYWMGEQKKFGTDHQVHQVHVEPFMMGRYEVTVGQFAEFVQVSGYLTDADRGGGSHVCRESGEWELKEAVNWKHDSQGNPRPKSEYHHPVIHVSWNDAVAYCRWLSRASGESYRLPTEAEWEYAARNRGKRLEYAWGTGMPAGKDGGNVADETAKRKFDDWQIFQGFDDGHVFTAPVGSFPPNALGLYDLTGNVWEWCADWYDSHYYQKSPTYDPKGATDGPERVMRGGSWYNKPNYARVTFREKSSPSNRSDAIGFRVAKSIE